MNLLKRGIPFWSIIGIQILSFFYIFFTLSGNTTTLVFIFPFIAGEILIFTPILFKKKKKYFYIGWELLIFFYALILIIFNFDFTFQVYNPDIITISFFASMLLLIEGLVLSYMIFRERAVKKILFVLASSTTVIVFLIVFFVMSEGIYAFNENDPVEFITGDYWRPGYEIESSESILITTTVESYNFSVISNYEYIYISPNSNRLIKILLENNGAHDDTYFLDLNFDEEINVSTNNNEITIQSHKQKEISLFLNSTSEIGNYEINFIATSKSTNQKREVKIICKVSKSGIDLTPDIQSIKAYQSGVNLMFRVPLELTNTGIFNDTYILTIDSPSYFSPSLDSEDEEWNYLTSSMNFDLISGESKNITLIPRMISRIVGTHKISVTAISENDTNIQESADLYFIYSIKNYIRTNITSKTIAPTGSINYSFTLQGLKGGTLDIKIENAENKYNTLVKNETGIVLSNEGRETIDLDENGTASIQLQVFSMNGQENDVSTIKMTVFKPGYAPSYGILPFIVGTFLTTFIALIIAIPLALGCAIFLAEYCPKKIRNILRPIYELLAGIPSVLFGLWGFLAFGPWLAENVYPLLTNTLGQFLWFFSDSIKIGNDILTASIVLSIMILPIIITLSEDSIRSVPRSFKEGSLAMGATKWQTIRRVLLPASKSGIVSSIILAMGRAIGETMAVLMIMQYSPDMPKSLFDAVGTMTSVIATQLGDSFSDDLTRHALFAIGMILFFIIFGLNIIIFLIQRERKNKSKSGFLSKFNFFKKISRLIILTGLINSEKIPKKVEFEILEEKIYEKSKDDKKFSNQTFKNVKKTINRFPKKSKKMLMPFPPRLTSERAIRNEKIMMILFIMAAIIVSIFLFFILGDIVLKGAPAIKFEYLFQTEVGIGVEGGFANAIIGSLQLVGIALAVAVPLSLGAAIYVQEYAKSDNIATKIILFASDTLASTPSIIFGGFGLILFVWYLRFGFSLLAGGLTLGFMVIPLMLRSSIEAIKSVPQGYREGSLALGATKWQTIKNVVLPPAFPTITSGIIISIGRAIGETAAIIFTAAYATSIARSIMQPVGSLTNLIYKNYRFTTKYPVLGEKVYAAALILIIIVLILNTIPRIIASRSSKMKG